MIRAKTQRDSPQIIDLTGPDGNAYVLLAIAQRSARQLGYSMNQIEELTTKMKSGDYENLINVFDSHFGDFFILER